MLFDKFCPRKLVNCIPYSNIVSDDKSTFVCCGDSDKKSRSVEEDYVRFCFKSETSDTMFDYDEDDLKDQIAVMADALALSRR